MSNKRMLGWLLVVLAVPVFAASPVISAQKVHYHWAPTALHAEPCTRTDCDQSTVWQPGGAHPQIIGGGTDGNWVSYPPPSTNADRMCSANVYDIEHNMMYMIGGDPQGYYGVAYNQRFNPVTNTWTNMADMPGARTWLDGEGSYCRHLNKIYIAGGYTGSANNNMWEYDIATNTWSAKATMPSATLAYGSCIWNDSLIYILGGAGPSLSGSNVVQVYNVNRNTWATATSMPEAGDMGSACIVGDTIFITNFYNRQSGSLWSTGRKGVINSSNPLSITWSNLPTSIPTLGFNGGTTELGGWVYRLGGFAGLSGGAHKRGWRYQPSTGQFETLPWLPSPPNNGVARCNFLCGWELSNELAKVAGDDEGDWGTPNNTYYRNQFTPPHDVGVSAILEPPSPNVQNGVTVTPKVKVKNYGLNAEGNFAVNFKIDSAGVTIYEDGALVDSIYPGEEVEVEFSTPWTPNCALWSGYTVTSYTVLDGDAIAANDTLHMFMLYTLDTIYSYRSSSTPSIDGYIAPGEWDDAYYVNASNFWGWGGTPYPPNAAKAWFKHDGNYLYAAFAMPLAMTRDIGDQIGFYLDENNDGQWATDNSEGNYWYWVNGSGVDEVLYRPITPSGPGVQGVAPGAQSVTGVFNGYLVFETKTPFGVLPYQLNMNPAGDTAHLWFFELDNNRFFGWWNAGMPADSWLVPSWYGTIILQTLQSGDVGVKSIDAPAYGQPGNPVTPKATWKNYGSTAMNFTAWYLINDPDGNRVYAESQSGSLAGGAEIQFTFPNYTPTVEGQYAVKCSTVAGGDVNPANDIKQGSFRVSSGPPVQPGWKEMASILNQVKDGGFLVYNEENGLVYAARGYKSGDFYQYDPNADTMGAWTALAPAPSIIGKGGNGCYGGGYVYVMHGQNTAKFSRYNIADNSWEALPDIPPWTSGKNPKGGGDLVYAVVEDVPYVYLLKGYKQDFGRFNVQTSTWESLPAAPAGAKPKWDKGSWMVYDGANTIYAHKAKYSELWTFDVATGQWGSASLPGIPTASSKTGKNKKPKDGSDGAYFQGFLFALKGGNTCELWRDDVAGGTGWTELDLMPEVGSTGKKKRVKAGGSFVSAGNWIFYALKGGKTSEFWRYVAEPPAFASTPERSGVMGQTMTPARFGFALTPNPLVKGYGLLSYSVPQAGEARVKVFDVTGRTVAEFGFVAQGTGTRSLDLRQLSAGIYLVKFEAAGQSASQ
ncbi:MAG: kelch repeat-containing protein, partial [candidate division WOR-3 bacterium]